MKSLKLLFFVTEDWYFCSHRLPLAGTSWVGGESWLVLATLDLTVVAGAMPARWPIAKPSRRY